MTWDLAHVGIRQSQKPWITPDKGHWHSIGCDSEVQFVNSNLCRKPADEL